MKLARKRSSHAAASIAFILIAGFYLAAMAAGAAHSYGKTTVYFFWSTGCRHCKEENAFLTVLAEKYPELDIKSFEVKNDPENAKLLSELADSFGVSIKGVPATFIGGFAPVVGYRNAESTGRLIEARIRECIEVNCPDPINRLGRPPGLPLMSREGLKGKTQEQGICGQDVECPEEEKVQTDPRPEERHIIPPPSASDRKESVIRLPLLGELDISGDALFYQTIVIAGIDGFNPCAFFVLFTLLGLLVHVQSRKKLILVGGTFVFFSGLIYFIFMAAWLNIFLLTGKIAAVTIAAGAIALFIAFINIKDFFYFRRGLSLVIPEKAKPGLFDRMRKLLKAASFPSVITGTVVLAAAANIYELFCTAGFPMVYTRILTLHNLTKVHYYLYLVFYNVIYVIPLALVVLFFALTLGAKKLTERQGQTLKLVSGLMMLCLGTVLLANPELLNNITVTAGLLVISLAATGIIVFAAGRRRVPG